MLSSLHLSRSTSVKHCLVNIKLISTSILFVDINNNSNEFPFFKSCLAKMALENYYFSVRRIRTKILSQSNSVNQGSLPTHQLEYGPHVMRLCWCRCHRHCAYALTSNITSHDYHEKTNWWASFACLYGYGALLLSIWIVLNIVVHSFVFYLCLDLDCSTTLSSSSWVQSDERTLNSGQFEISSVNRFLKDLNRPLESLCHSSQPGLWLVKHFFTLL